MSDDALWRELADLRRRVEQLETRLGTRATGQAAPAMTETPAARAAFAEPVHTSITKSSPPETAPTAAPPISPPYSPIVHAAPAAPPTIREPSRVAPPPIVPSKQATPKRQTLEVLVGGKAMAWIGALAVLLGAAFLVHYGYQQGWWAQISPGIRCLLIAVFGLLLAGGGELAMRKINTLASVGLFAAGLGTLYLDTYAAWRQFDLVSQELAFLLMGLTAIIGFGITLRTEFKTIGVVSMIAAYATPILLAGSGGHDLEVLAYLTLIFGISLGLSITRPRSFRSLRYVALAGQMLLGLIWLVSLMNVRIDGVDRWLLGAVTISLWWSMLAAECVIAATRRESKQGNVAATLIATAGYVTAVVWLLDSFAPTTPTWLGSNWHGIFTACIGVVCAVIALQFGTGLEALRRKADHAVDILTAAMWLQCGVLSATAIALQFREFGEVVGWLAIALACVEMGRRLPSRGVAVFGILVAGLALLVLSLRGVLGGALTQPLVVLVDGGIEIDRWAILSLLTIAAMVTVAKRLRSEHPGAWVTLPWVIMALACIGWLVTTTRQCEGLWQTGAWLSAAAFLLGFERFGRRERFLDLSLLTLAATVGHWMLFDAVSVRLQRNWDALDLLPAINSQFGMLVAICLVGAWGYRVLQTMSADASPQLGRGFRSTLAACLPAVLGVVVMIGMSFELERMISRMELQTDWRSEWQPYQLRALWLTALWASGGAAMVMIGRLRAIRPTLVMGWIILTMSTVAWLTLETVADRVINGHTPATLLLNAQAMAGMLLLGLLAATARLRLGWLDGVVAPMHEPTMIRPASMVLAGLVLLWLGSLEIERAMWPSETAVQAGLSVYWAMFGIALVVVGFARRVALVRHAGLALLFVTMGKVLVLDMQGAGTLWRVGSFIGSGLLFIATSMVYARLSSAQLAVGDETAHAGDTLAGANSG